MTAPDLNVMCDRLTASRWLGGKSEEMPIELGLLRTATARFVSESAPTGVPYAARKLLLDDADRCQDHEIVAQEVSRSTSIDTTLRVAAWAFRDRAKTAREETRVELDALVRSLFIRARVEEPESFRV